MGVYHARLGPSSASRWTDCTASAGAQDGYPNTTSEASRAGTTGHQIGAECLEHGHDPNSYVGRYLCFLSDRREVWREQLADDDALLVTHEERVTFELAEAVAKYVNYVNTIHATLGGEMIVEQPVPIDHITGEQGATGMSDCIIVSGETLVTVDAKFGRGKVYAYDVIEPETYDLVTGEIVPPKLRMNLQLAMYLLGAYEKYALLSDFTQVKAVIVQPMLNHVSEYECSIEELMELKAWLSERAEATRTNPEFKPNGKNCHFCRAKYDCHARNRDALETALEGFEDVATARPKPITLPKLGDLYSKIDMIRSWCDDVEKRVMDELLAGKKVIRGDGIKYKLVEGRRGAKEWDDPAAIEKMMLEMKLKPDVIYTRKLVTPSQAEKLAETRKGKNQSPADEPKKPIGKVKWNRLTAHIHQPPGKPVVAPQTDPRPVYVKPDTSGFGEVDSKS